MHDARGLDLRELVMTATAEFDRNRAGRVVVHVGGGPNYLSHALMLAAFDRGHEAFFCNPKGIARLPIATRVSIEDRFSPAEASVVRALRPVAASRLESLKVAGLSSSEIKGALLRLRDKDLVKADNLSARLTPLGRYYREQFLAVQQALRPE